MPCYRCGARQTDPVGGVSPWDRGVIDDRHVLVCPDCQSTHDWTADLDRCAACGSRALVCRLGEIECRCCSHLRPTQRPAEDQPGTSSTPGLSEEVAQALDRVLERRPALG